MKILTIIALLFLGNFENPTSKKLAPLLLVQQGSIIPKPCGTQFKLNNVSYSHYFNSSSSKLKVWFRKVGTTTWSHKVVNGGSNLIKLSVCGFSQSGKMTVSNYELHLTTMNCNAPNSSCSASSPVSQFTTQACCCNCPVPAPINNDRKN
jgi:hypothetical protein